MKSILNNRKSRERSVEREREKEEQTPLTLRRIFGKFLLKLQFFVVFSNSIKIDEVTYMRRMVWCFFSVQKSHLKETTIFLFFWNKQETKNPFFPYPEIWGILGSVISSCFVVHMMASCNERVAECGGRISFMQTLCNGTHEKDTHKYKTTPLIKFLTYIIMASCMKNKNVYKRFSPQVQAWGNNNDDNITIDFKILNKSSLNTS